MVAFDIFWQQVNSFNYRKERLKLPRLSLRADLLKQRCSLKWLNFTHLMQADFILFIKAELDCCLWRPETLLYISRSRDPFEIFARAESKEYFEKIKYLFGIKSLEDFKRLLNEYKQGRRELPKWQFESFDPELLLNIDNLSTQP